MDHFKKATRIQNGSVNYLYIYESSLTEKQLNGVQQSPVYKSLFTIRRKKSSERALLALGHEIPKKLCNKGKEPSPRI